MDCIEFENRLNEQFGPARFEEAADLDCHAEQCPACRALLDQFRLVSDSLELWREQVPEVDLSEAIVSDRRAAVAAWTAHADERRLASSRRVSSAKLAHEFKSAQAGIVARPAVPGLGGRVASRVWLAGVSLAALVVAAVFIFWPREDASQPIHRPQLAGNTERPAEVATEKGAEDQDVDRPPAAVPAPFPGPQGAAYYDLAQKAAGALDDVSAFVMTGTAALTPASEAGAQEAGGWIDGLQHQLQPIGRSLDDAFDFLWQAGQSADSSQS